MVINEKFVLQKSDVDHVVLGVHLGGGDHLKLIIDNFFSGLGQSDGEANSVGDDHISVEASEDDSDVLEGSITIEFLILTKLLLQDWEVLSQGGGGEVEVWLGPEIRNSLGVKDDVSEVGLGDIVGNASGGRLGDDELGHG